MRPARKVDEPALVAGWRCAYRTTFPYKYPQRWRWLFNENPFSSWVNEERLPITLAIRGGAVGAWAGSMQTPVFCGNRVLRAAFSVNTFTLPNARRQGLGQRIQTRIAQDFPILWSISLSTANRKCKRRAGAVSAQPLYVCCRRLRELDADALGRSLDSLLRTQRKRFLTRLAVASQTLPARAGLQLLARRALRRSPILEPHADCDCQIEFVPIDQFDADWDAFWRERIRPSYDFGVDRSSEYMNWKFVQQPLVTFRRQAIHIDGRMAGVLVYRMGTSPELPTGLVAESILEPQTSPACFRYVVRHVTRELDRSGAIVVQWGTGAQDQLNILQEEGYRLVRINVPMVNVGDEVRDLYRDHAVQARWLLSLGDHDQDQFQLDQQPSFRSLKELLRGRVAGLEDFHRDADFFATGKHE